MSKKKIKGGFSDLPTPIKIIIFQAITNLLFSVSEYALTIQPTDIEMVVRQFFRFISLTLLNIATWYLTQMREKNTIA